eukprot:Sspe_Gene.86352::Locus_57031_Transcript_1_1_Confidence_1.000_Length_730::g.86352::m.86352
MGAAAPTPLRLRFSDKESNRKGGRDDGAPSPSRGKSRGESKSGSGADRERSAHSPSRNSRSRVLRDMRRMVSSYMAAHGADQPVELLDPTIPLAIRLSLVNRDFGANDYELLLALDEGVDRSAPESAINVLPCSIATEVGSCSVCLNDIAAGETMKSLPCRHAFHAECIDRWLRSYNSFCPLCKAKVADTLAQHQ